MALFDENEPPSFQEKEIAEKTKILSNQNTKNKHYFLYLKSKLFYFFDQLGKIAETLKNSFVATKNAIFSAKFSPHLALIIMALIVCVTNLAQKNAAKAYYEQIITVNPDVAYAVTESVSPYTPLLKDSPTQLHKNLVADSIADGFLSTTSTVATEVTIEPVVLPNNDGATIEYVVLPGDTLSGLGMKFDVKIATLKYLNNVDNENMIKPGVKLKIPPKNYEVSASAIAKKEKERKAKLAVASRNTVTRDSTVSGRATAVNSNPGAKVNGYPYGWCTYYVATRRYVPTSWGNARSWLSSAKRAGYSTGSEPAAGAIVVTAESGLGHVAYVESVDGDSITISEMNYKGWGVTSRRTISAYGGVVRGYVY